MLEERFKEYLDQAEILKTLNRDYREIQKEDELYPELERLKDELATLRDKLKSKTEIALIKEKKDSAKDRLDLLKDILLGEMAEQGKLEVEANGKKARIVSKVKFEKSKV